MDQLVASSQNLTLAGIKDSRATEMRSEWPFPLEVSYAIVEFVPLHRMSTFLLVNKYLNRTCEPILYRDIDLTSHPTRSLLLARTLIQSKRLAALVRTCKFSPYHPNRPMLLEQIRSKIPILSFDERQHNLERLATLATLSLVNVESIGFWGVPRDFHLTHRKVRRIYYHPRWLCHDHSYDMVTTYQVPTITHLELSKRFDRILWNNDGKQSFDSEDLQDLEELVAPFFAARQLVPGRRIRRLFVLSDSVHEEVPALISTLSRGLAPIERFGLGFPQGHRWQPSLATWLASLSNVLHDIQYMSLDFDAESEPRHELPPFSSSAFLEPLREFLKGQICLHTLDLLEVSGLGTVIPYLSRARVAPTSEYIKGLENWSIARPTLSTVILPDGSTWKHDVQNGTWQQAFQKPLARRPDVEPSASLSLKGRIGEPWPQGPIFKADQRVDDPDALSVALLAGRDI